jgi:four helix bundle protein
MAEMIASFRDLRVYQTAFELCGEVFQLTKKWPAEERFALTSQIRRSSRAIGANIAESWAKRRYEAHFISKLTDADGELQETFHWLDVAHFQCGYVGTEQHQIFLAQLTRIGKMLGKMMNNPAPFLQTAQPPSIIQRRRPASDLRPLISGL